MRCILSSSPRPPTLSSRPDVKGTGGRGWGTVCAGLTLTGGENLLLFGPSWIVSLAVPRSGLHNDRGLYTYIVKFQSRRRNTRHVTEMFFKKVFPGNAKTQRVNVHAQHLFENMLCP